jgi:L-threonylcarbamoyladenylate synthase
VTHDGTTADTAVLLASSSAIEQALALLRSGEIVAFPTDTVYGVGADCLDAAAIEKLFEAKLRPRGKPIALLAGSAGDVTSVAASWPRAAETLAGRFWPGGLTIVVEAGAVLPSVLTAGSGKIGIRVPDNAVAQALIGGLGRPVAATSANLSGQPSLATAAEVAASLNGRLRLVLDGGRCSGGVESTVIDVTTDTPTILRLGAISPEPIAEALGVWPVVL